jgi:hypothetical protein
VHYKGEAVVGLRRDRIQPIALWQQQDDSSPTDAAR